MLYTAAGCVSNHQADRAAYSLIGTWSAQAEETVDSAGRTVASSPATGMLVDTPEGRVAVRIVELPRPVVPAVAEGRDHVDAWDGEQAVIETYDAYLGTYEADVVRDYDEALGFYVGTLGFRLIEDTAIPAQGKRCGWSSHR